MYEIRRQFARMHQDALLREAREARLSRAHRQARPQVRTLPRVRLALPGWERLASRDPQPADR